MGQLSVAEDLSSVFIVVCLMAVSVTALTRSYHIFAERKNMYEDFGVALDVASRLAGEVLVKHGNSTYPGLLNPKSLENEFKGYREFLLMQDIDLSIEVRSLDGKTILAYGERPSRIRQYFSPPCSVSLPIVVAEAPTSKVLGELVVWVWR